MFFKAKKKGGGNLAMFETLKLKRSESYHSKAKTNLNFYAE